MNFRLAKWIMDHRVSVGILFIIVTMGFMVGIPHVQIRTIFKDLLPHDDPFVQVYYDHPNFGNPLLISVMVKRKVGDIYNHETLNKVWQMTRDLDLAPHVNHDTLISISTEKLRYAEATKDGVDLQALMDNHAPKSPEELAEFRSRVQRSPNARSFYISPDETATLITVAFLDSVDYGESFKYVHDLVEKAQDADHIVYVAGQPILTLYSDDRFEMSFLVPAPTFQTLRLGQQIEVKVADLPDLSLKGEIAGYGVMEKGSGWGAEYPPELRNGEWEYRVFTAQKTPNTQMKLNACFECHKAQASHDFIHAYEKLQEASPLRSIPLWQNRHRRPS